ncbi:MAG: ABC transporter permease subunit [Fimbriiglobus sp.]
MLGPIFTRELTTVPRRASHYSARTAILGLLGILGVTAWQATVGFTREATLGETARFGLLLFQIIVFVQLVLLIFFAALSAASAVSQEKDRRTFVLLLITDMYDYEIVLGKLFGSLLPITVLLAVTVPVLSMLLLLGGIDPSQVWQACAVMFTTAFVAGSLGGVVALWRERTFQSLALSVLLISLYLALVQAVPVLGPLLSATTDWELLQAAVDPFSAMRSVLDMPPGGWTGMAPAYMYSLVMLGGFIALNAFGIWKLRAWNPSGEPIMQREKTAVDPEADLSPDQLKEFRAKAHAAPGQVREVWENPVVWREIRTYAYGRRPLLVKFAFLFVLAFLWYYSYTLIHAPGGRVPFAAAYGLVPLAVLSLLLVAAQAVTAITSERDGGALDVLLVTDISPYEFVFGKIFGVLYNAKEYIIPPLILAVYFCFEGMYTRVPPGASSLDRFLANLGPLIAVLIGLVVMFAFVISLGLHVSLRNINSRLAIVNTLGTVFFLSVGTLICIYLIVINGGSFANQWLSFIAFLVLGIGGLVWVLSGDRPSTALTLGSVFCPLAMFYCVTNIIIAKPGTDESADPLVPFLALAAAFGFTISAIMIPLLSEFDVALGRTTAAYEE